MQRMIYLLAALLLTAASVSAQKMPERAAVRRGNRQFNAGNYEQAVERYRQALRDAPGTFEAIYDLGNGLYRLEQYAEAEEALQAAAADSLRSDTDRAAAFYNLGNAQFRQQKYREALESYKQSLLLEPSDMETKYNYAYTKKLLEQNDQNGGGGNNNQNNPNNDQQQNQDQNQNQNQDQNQNQNQDQNQNGKNDSDSDNRQQPDDPKQDPNPPQGDPRQRPAGISEQEQQQMLDAIQAQEDRTQEKLKEKQGVVVRGKKNW